MGVSPSGRSRPARPHAGGRSGTWRRTHDGVRETVESIVVAFVLAFLFRTFEVEAFVIPTGSMAPTLLGRHLDLECPVCGYAFAAGVSTRKDGSIEGIDRPCCANCGHLIPEPLDPHDSFKGDRILVVKFPYDLRQPERWDVIVFKFPEDPSINYIKRLVGLPGELVELHGGDVYIDDRIARKPLGKIRALRQLVYDNNYIPTDAQWQRRWAASETGREWQGSADGRSFSFNSTAKDAGLQRLEYRHWVRDRPSPGGSASDAGEYWITDFYGYDSTSRVPQVRAAMCPVDDLFVTFDLTVLRPSGQLVCEIVESRRGERVDRLQAAFDLDAHTLTLRRRGDVLGEVRGVSIRTGQKTRVEVSNVDSQLIVALDGKQVGPARPYDPEWQMREAATGRDGVGPMRPVALGARNTQVRVSNLIVHRDIHYRLPQWNDARGCAPPPARWQLSTEQLFVLGDNSPNSEDSREWHDDGCRQGAAHLLASRNTVYRQGPRAELQAVLPPFQPDGPGPLTASTLEQGRRWHGAAGSQGTGQGVRAARRGQRRQL